MPAGDLVLRADRSGAEPGPGARGPDRQAQEPGRRPAGLHQSLGVRLYAADADPDGGAVLPQRGLQAARRRLVARRRGVEGLYTWRLLQRLHPGPARLAILAGECRDLRHRADRAGLSVPDLATALAALHARRRRPAPRPVRRPDEPLVLLVRHDHGAHEIPAPRVAAGARRVVEAKNQRD